MNAISFSNTASIDANEQTLFVVLPENVDDLLNTVEHELKANDLERGVCLYHYLIDRRKGLTHSEAIHALRLIDRRYLAQRMKHK